VYVSRLPYTRTVFLFLSSPVRARITGGSFSCILSVSVCLYCGCLVSTCTLRSLSSLIRYSAISTICGPCFVEDDTEGMETACESLATAAVTDADEDKWVSNCGNDIVWCIYSTVRLGWVLKERFGTW